MSNCENELELGTNTKCNKYGLRQASRISGRFHFAFNVSQF